MIAAIDKLSSQMRQREQQAQTRFDATLADIYRKVALVALVFLSGIVVLGIVIARSIRLPLQELMAAMQAIVSGNYDRDVRGTDGARRDRRDGARRRGVPRERHRQAPGRERAARLQGARREGAGANCRTTPRT